MCSSEVKKINTTFENEVFFFFCICGWCKESSYTFYKKKIIFLFMRKEFCYHFYKNNECMSWKRKFVLYVIWNMESFYLLYIILVYEKYCFYSFEYPLIK